LAQYKPHTGHTWVADEIVIKAGGEKYWVWDVMDANSRYLLATYVTPYRGTREAEVVFRRALEKADRPPKVIVTDRLASYVDGIERVFGSDSSHIQSGGIRSETNNNLSERLQGTIRQREKVMRGLKSKETAQKFMDGWALHYNYFRPHESLDGKTPASVAGIKAPLTNWEMVAKQDVRPFSCKRVALERERLHEPIREPIPVRPRRLADRSFKRGRGF
jgi:putative transposase